MVSGAWGIRRWLNPVTSRGKTTTHTCWHGTCWDYRQHLGGKTLATQNPRNKRASRKTLGIPLRRAASRRSVGNHRVPSVWVGESNWCVSRRGSLMTCGERQLPSSGSGWGVKIWRFKGSTLWLKKSGREAGKVVEVPASCKIP